MEKQTQEPQKIGIFNKILDKIFFYIGMSINFMIIGVLTLLIAIILITVLNTIIPTNRWVNLAFIIIVNILLSPYTSKIKLGYNLAKKYEHFLTFKK